MIYKIIPRCEFASNLPPGGDQVQLHCYLRSSLGVIADSGHRCAVIICPGGGFRRVAPAEGEPVALAFLAAGIQSFVLEYSVAPTHYPIPFMELAASVAWVRTHAAEYGIDPCRIAVCGFSAGGYLAGCLSTSWDNPVLKGLCSASDIFRPDASILCYPVITSLSGQGHTDSFSNLFGADKDVPFDLSLENSVSSHTPPTFLWATVTDSSVSVNNTMIYAAALQRAGVPFELHLYAEGPHAMGLATPESARNPEHEDPHVSSWHNLCIDWLHKTL